MFLLNEPDETGIRSFIAGHENDAFSYPEVGATRNGLSPDGYDVDRNRILLGCGRETYQKAVEAVRSWKMFDISWLRLFWTDTPIEAGRTVCVLARHLGFRSLNACRIVYAFEERGEVEKFGFAYGTLPAHVERGEERFSVERHKATDEVWYDIYAFSRPRHALAKLAYPFSRFMQKRFAEESKRAMARACE